MSAIRHIDWIGLDHKVVDWTGLDLGNWTHVQIWSWRLQETD